MGFQTEQNVRVPLQLLRRSHSTAASPLSSHRDEMKNQHTVKNGLSSFSRAGSHHPFKHSVSPSRITNAEAKVEGYFGIKRHSPPLSLSLISSPLPLSSFSQLIFCFHNAPTGCCASVCVLLSSWRQKKLKSSTPRCLFLHQTHMTDTL